MPVKTRTSKSIAANVTPAPANQRPNVELISWESYQKDITNRWNIHHFEMKELAQDVKFLDNFARRDFTKVVDFFTPIVTQLVKRIENLQTT